MLIPLEGLNIKNEPQAKQVSKTAKNLILELAGLQKQITEIEELDEKDKAFAKELKKLDFDNLQINFTTDNNGELILEIK